GGRDGAPGVLLVAAAGEAVTRRTVPGGELTIRRINRAHPRVIVLGELTQGRGAGQVPRAHGRVGDAAVAQAQEMPGLVGDDGRQIELHVRVARGDGHLQGVDLDVRVEDLAGLRVVRDD